MTDLLDELRRNPRQFNESGRGVALLGEMKWRDVQELRPLLADEEVEVRRAAVFVLSELGAAAAGVVEDVIPLLTQGDTRLAYDAMEVVAVCSTGSRASLFAHVVSMLDSDDRVLSGLAMRLMARADEAQLAAASNSALLGAQHRSGLAIARGVQSPGGHGDARYAAVAAYRENTVEGGRAFDSLSVSSEASVREFHDWMKGEKAYRLKHRTN